MLCSAFRLVVVAIALAAMPLSQAPKNRPAGKPAPPAQSKEQLALWLARAELSRQVGDKTLEKFAIMAQRQDLFRRKASDVAAELRKRENLEEWKPSETEELDAARVATDELYKIMKDALEISRKKAVRDTTKKKAAPKAPAGPSAAHSPGETALRRELGLLSGVAQNEEQELLFKTWEKIQDAFVSTYFRVAPGLTADRYVEEFQAETLIGNWERADTKEVAGSTPVRHVVYRVVDAYGTPRRGIIAVWLRGDGKWEVTRDNKGGFLELVRSPLP